MRGSLRSSSCLGRKPPRAPQLDPQRPAGSTHSSTRGLRPPEHQAPLSMEFSRQEYWSGLSFPSPGDPPDPGIVKKDSRGLSRGVAGNPGFLKEFPGGSDGKVSAYNAGDLGSNPGSGRSFGEGNGTPLQYSCLENPMDEQNWLTKNSIPWSGRSPGKGNVNPLQYSCLENSMDRGSWWATVHRVAKSWT